MRGMLSVILISVKYGLIDLSAESVALRLDCGSLKLQCPHVLPRRPLLCAVAQLTGSIKTITGVRPTLIGRNDPQCTGHRYCLGVLTVFSCHSCLFLRLTHHSKYMYTFFMCLYWSIENSINWKQLFPYWVASRLFWFCAVCIGHALKGSSCLTRVPELWCSELMQTV